MTYSYVLIRPYGQIIKYRACHAPQYGTCFAATHGDGCPRRHGACRTLPHFTPASVSVSPTRTRRHGIPPRAGSHHGVHREIADHTGREHPWTGPYVRLLHQRAGHPRLERLHGQEKGLWFVRLPSSTCRFTACRTVWGGKSSPVCINYWSLLRRRIPQPLCVKTGKR